MKTDKKVFIFGCTVGIMLAIFGLLIATYTTYIYITKVDPTFYSSIETTRDYLYESVNVDSEVLEMIEDIANHLRVSYILLMLMNWLYFILGAYLAVSGVNMATRNYKSYKELKTETNE